MNTAIIFPPHKCSLTLTHNEHRGYYEKLSDYIADREFQENMSSEELQRCLDTDELWELQWYPRTPVGFCRVCAPTLEEVLKKASEMSE